MNTPDRRRRYHNAARSTDRRRTRMRPASRAVPPEMCGWFARWSLSECLLRHDDGRRRLHLLEIGCELPDRFSSRFVLSIPYTLKEGHILAEGRRQIRKGVRSPLQFGFVFAIRFEL